MSDQPPDLTGRALGHFRVEGVIGRGGMSTLYRAADTRLGRRVALKVIDPALAADPEFRERFHGEARNTSAIDHAHVVPLYDFDETDGHLYIAMRFVEGPDLAGLIAGRPLAVPRALRLLGQVGDALDAVHARGLVHLDVKPANVLVTTRESADGEHVYLADFGLTRRGATGHRTSGGDFLGSPTYAAPEHLRGEPVDARSDVYSLTCVLFSALTGRAPYLGSVTEVIEGHLHGTIPSAASLAGLDPRLDEVVHRGMDPDPPRRFASAGAVVEAARAALSAGARPHEPVPALPADPPRRHPPRGEGATTTVVAGAATAGPPEEGAVDPPSPSLAPSREAPGGSRGPGAARPAGTSWPAAPPVNGRPRVAPGPGRPGAPPGPLTRASVAPPVRIRDPLPPVRDRWSRRGPAVTPWAVGAAAGAVAVVLLVLFLVL